MRPSAVIAGLASLLVVASLSGQDVPPSVAVTAGQPPTRGLRDRAELEAFVDGTMAAFLRDKHIAGATVSVVKDGELFFAKGYGSADVAAKAPVSAERTLFRIGSISKLFTWTAIMQLVEQGKLDLDRDVNEYLDFEIPDTYPEPITLKHIMAHTPGFEEDSRDLFTTDSTHLTPMGTWLPAHMPKRVRPPGQFSSYSNWATALAGYIVERTSGMSWDEYIERHILAPLGMNQTTGRQPLPASLSADMSKGYQWKDGQYVAKDWEMVTGAAPAGSMSSSATDMARFMIAHLNKGALGDARILSEATATQMYTRTQGHDARIPGFNLGFYEQSSHGLRLYGHGGDTGWFHSDLALFPSENVGVFISTNTDTGGGISFQPFLLTFLDHYYPENLPVIKPTEEAKVGAKRYAGQYLFNRRNFSTYQKVFDLASVIAIDAAEDGALVMQSPFGALRLVSIDSLLFRDVVSGAKVAFREDAAGNITHGFLDAAPMMVLDKQTGLARPGLHRGILGLGLFVFAALLIAAVVRFLNRNAPGRVAAPGPVSAGRKVMVVVALLQLGFVLVLVQLASNPEAIFAGAPASLKVGLALPVLGLVLTLVGAWIGITQWRQNAGTTMTRIRHLAVVVVALLFFWSLNTWNLLGWRM